MDTGMLVSAMRTLLNYKASVLLERPSLCADKCRDDAWAHVLRLRVAECEEALGLPAEKMVFAYLVMQAQSAHVVVMLPKRAFIKSALVPHAWLPKEWISVYTNGQCCITFFLGVVFLTSKVLLFWLELLDVSVGQFAVPFNAFVSMSCHAVGSRYHLFISSSRIWQNFGSSCGNSWLEHFPVLFNETVVRFAFALSTTPVYTWSRNVSGFNRSTLFICIFRNWLHFQFLYCQFDVAHVNG